MYQKPTDFKEGDCVIKKSAIFLIAVLTALLFFQTVSAVDVPILSNETPTHMATGISLQPTCKVVVTNGDGNNSTVDFYTSPDGSVWTWKQNNTNVLNESVEFNYIEASNHNTKYYWKVTATNDDNETENISKIYYFTTAIEETSHIEIYPTNPKAGASLAVILKGAGYEGKNAKGLLCCNDNLYAFDMSNGVGVVVLDQQFYGTATLRVFSGEFSPPLTKSIDITHPSTDNIRLLASSTSVINKDTVVMLRFNQNPIPDFEVKITSPDGGDHYLITDKDGKIYPVLDVAGIWSFNTNVYGADITPAVTIAVYETLSLSYAGTPSVGVATVIATEPFASVKIFLDDGGELSLIEQHIASAQGIVEFTPTVGGSYKVQGTSSSKRSVCWLDVPCTVNIRITDALTSHIVVDFEKGKVYRITISNNAGISLNNVEVLYVATPFATTEILSLIDGKATWMPHLTGSYVFTVEETEMQAGASQHVIVREALVEGFDVAIPVVIVIILIIILIVIVVIYSHYKHIPLKNIFKNIKFGKKKTGLPFD